MHRLEMENEVFRREHSNDTITEIANLKSQLVDMTRLREKFETEFVASQKQVCEAQDRIDTFRARVAELETGLMNQKRY